jgi:radical SAM protein with 4Fe4S-binding SPASM domain
MGIFTRLQQRKSINPVKPPDTGLYHFRWNHGEQTSRIHLRLDDDNSGLLIINANRVFHLNPSAALMAYYTLSGTDSEFAVKALSRRFNVPKNTLHDDFSSYQNTLLDLINETACPICDLDLETTLPFTSKPSAPYRMDLALTYRCNNACAHCYNARTRNFPELKTKDWLKIIDRLWEIRIPHIVFTGGEPTLRDDLPELIQHAEQNGQITGLNTNGIKLADEDFLNSLVKAGLDHVQITLESHLPEIHDKMVGHKGAWEQTVNGIRNVANTGLYFMTNTTMLTHNSPYIPDTLHFLAKLGVPTVGLNALIYSGRGRYVGTGLDEKDLKPLLTKAKEITGYYGQRLIWYTPTQYCNFDPIEFDLGVKGCTAALYNMCLEPDGAVLPCQSYYHPVGNILSDKWEDIWNHELCIQLRERQNLPAKCQDCPIKIQCGGGCPLQFDNYLDSDESWRTQ